MKKDITTDPKEKKERDWVKEARRASSIFPEGELVSMKPPDPDILMDDGPLGIEVTELCREDERTNDAGVASIVDDAWKHYGRLSTEPAVNVVAMFSMDALKTIRRQVLVESLVKFVQTHGENEASELPEGYIDIVVSSPEGPCGRWNCAGIFEGIVISKERLEACIAEKNKRVAGYRRAAPTVWLLIVNDRFRGAGEVHTLHENLAQWRFAFDFEKVLVFLREADGRGEVFELQRV
jgi:hypothetical protein